MVQKWFLMQSEKVVGPMSADEIDRKLAQGDLKSTDLVWGMGLTTWVSLDQWRNERPRLEAAAKEAIPEPPSETWHYAYDGKSYGPFSRKDLLQQLKPIDNVPGISLWTKGMKEWAPIFEFHDVLSELGVNKRQIPRAEINGKAILKTNGVTLVAQLFSVSEGGFSIRLDAGLAAGQNVQAELQSPVFKDPVHAKAEVRYSANGFIGLKFSQVSAEHQAIIAQHVRQSQTRFVLKAA